MLNLLWNRIKERSTTGCFDLWKGSYENIIHYPFLLSSTFGYCTACSARIIS